MKSTYIVECSTGGVVCIIGGLDSALSIDSAPREQHHMPHAVAVLFVSALDVLSLVLLLGRHLLVAYYVLCAMYYVLCTM